MPTSTSGPTSSPETPEPPSVAPGTGEPAPPSRFAVAAEGVQQFLFGHDVFVSYARVDAKDYAIGLANALIERHIAAYVDQLGTPPGRELPALLMRRLTLSSMLVLIASRGARVSGAVRREVEEFRRRNHRIYVLRVDGALDDDGAAADATGADATGAAAVDNALWLRDLSMGATTTITVTELASGAPSSAVVEWVVQRMQFTRREERLRTTMRRTLASIAALLVLGGTAIGIMVGRTAAAARELGVATVARDSAVRAQVAAEAGRRLAEDSARAASDRAGRAAALQLRAESLAAVAADSEAVARDRAEAQRRVARALDLANQATAALDTTDASLARSGLLAVESLRLAWTPQGYAAWLRAAQLLPRPPDLVPGTERLAIVGVAVSADGRRLAAVDTTDVVRVLDLPSGRVVDSAARADLGGPFHRRVLALSADGRWLATVRQGRLDVRDLARGRSDTLPADCSSTVGPTSFGGTAPLLLSFACYDDQPRVFAFEREAWQQIVPRLGSGPMSAGADAVMATAVSPDGRWLAVARAKELELWDLGTRRPVARAPAPPPLHTVAFGPDSWRIAAAGPDVAVLWTLQASGSDSTGPRATLVERARWRSHSSGGLIAFSPDHGFLLTGGVAGEARLWEEEAQRERIRLIGAGGPIAFLPGNALLAGRAEGGVGRWSLDPGAEGVRLRVGDAPRHVGFSPDGRWLAVGSGSDTSRVFATPDWREAQRFAGGSRGVGFTADGRWLVAVGPADVRLVEPGTWRGVRALQAELVEQAALSPDGRWLATTARRRCSRVESKREVRVWSIDTGEEVAWSWSGCPNPNGYMADSTPPRTGGRAALVAAADGWARVAGGDRETRRSRDSTWAAAWDQGPDVTLLHGATGQTLGVLRHDGNVADVAFSADGALLATASADGSVRLWPVHPAARDELVRGICARLPVHELAPDDWRAYLPGEAPRRTCPAPAAVGRSPTGQSRPPVP